MFNTKSSAEIKTASKGSDIHFQYINDYGALSEVLIKPIN